jgi:hypothetical protein
MRKLGKLDQEIVDLLKSSHPVRLLWREIVAELFPKFETKYKSRKGFGSALSNRLSILEGKCIQHADDRYGVIRSPYGEKRTGDAEKTTFPRPRIEYKILPRDLPNVRFDLKNHSEYPVKIRIRVTTILDGRKLGLVESSNGYYNGRKEIRLEPEDGWEYGGFNIPPMCVAGKKRIVLTVRVTATDPDGKKHNLFPKSWTYDRDRRTWVYEP